jgi:hypothetical protein
MLGSAIQLTGGYVGYFTFGSIPFFCLLMNKAIPSGWACGGVQTCIGKESGTNVVNVNI